MSLIIDAREAFNPQKAGKGIYAFSLIMALAKQLRSEEVTLLTNRSPSKKLPSKWRVIKISGEGVAWQMKAARFVRQNPKSVLLSPTSYLLPLLVPNRSLVTVHDLITFLYPQRHNLKASVIEKFCLPRLINKAFLLPVSASTNKDLYRVFPHLKTEFTEVVQPGLAGNFKARKASLPRQKQAPLVLAVGTLIPRKNLTTLIQAFDQLLGGHEEWRQAKLQIVGAKGWQHSQLAQVIESMEFRRNLILPGYINNDKLSQAYHGADIFVFPSLYEGFGLPLLEAMATGTPILCSEIPPFTEVADDAALYFDPESVTELTQKLHYLLRNVELRTILQEKGLQRLKQFSWATAAGKIKQIYKSLARSHKS